MLLEEATELGELLKACALRATLGRIFSGGMESLDTSGTVAGACL
jgi:hypothetical protein